jgi:hypothetical protein
MIVQNSRKEGRSLKGIAHVHTTFSHDGEISLERLAAICNIRNIDFVLISEHAQDLDEHSFAKFVKNANQCSTRNTLLISGLEYEGENDVHLLAYGISSFIDPKKKLVDIAPLVQKQGGLSIIAHPKRNGYFVPNDLVDFINGIEIWNTKMDGSFAPNAKSLSLLRALRLRNAKIHGYAGLDLHWDNQKIMVFVDVFGAYLQKEVLFSALQNGNFIVSNAFLHLKSNGNESVINDWCFAFVNTFNAALTDIAKKIIYRRLKAVFGNKIGRALKRYSRRFLY